MKVSCLQENLAKGLSIVGRAVSVRSVLPVLHNILLATDQGLLKLSATDLSTSITCWIGAKVHEEGAATIPARLLTDFVNSLPQEQVDLELITRTQEMQLTCARHKAKIKILDAQEFPLIPTTTSEQKVSIDPAVFREMVEQVTFAAASDETRPILTGVLSDFEPDRLILAASDGFRLSVRSAPMKEALAEKKAIIVPARALMELGRLAQAAEEPIDMLIPPRGNQVLFRLQSKELGGPVEVVSQLIEGRFPDYNQIIPKASTNHMVIGTAEFLRAAKIALLFARDAANIVRLHLAPGRGVPGTLTIASTAAEVGDDVSQLEAEIEGEPLEIAFNGRYLIDVLNAVHTDQVILETSTPSSPGVFRPKDKSDFVHVIMPMHISR